MPRINQKGNAAPVIILLLLLAAIAVGVYLSQQKTNLLPKAAEDAAITCKPRPLCLDESPPCKMPEPDGGWCPAPKNTADTDRDGFDDNYEKKLGTSPVRACPADNKDDAWPPDINNTGIVNFLDISLLTKYINNPKLYTKRYDLDLNGNITKDDMMVIQKYLGQICKKPNPSPVNLPKASLKMIYPKGGESFKNGSTVHVTWTAKGVDEGFVLFFEDKNGGRTFMPDYLGDPKLTSYDWKVNANPGSSYRLILEGYNFGVAPPVATAMSGYFTITSP